MSKIVRWETPFTDAFYPSVVLLTRGFSNSTGKGGDVQAIVAPDGIDKYPKYLIDFGEVLVFTSMDEGCCPERDFGSAVFDETITEEKFVSAFQWIDSPWLKSYEGCHDPNSEDKFSHYMIYGGDNNIEVITQNKPEIRIINKQEIIKANFEI